MAGYQRDCKMDSDMHQDMDPENEEHLKIWRESLRARCRENQSKYPDLFLPRPQSPVSVNSDDTEDLITETMLGGKRKTVDETVDNVTTDINENEDDIIQ